MFFKTPLFLCACHQKGRQDVSFFSFAEREVALKPFAAELAGWALSTPVALYAVVASERALSYQPQHTEAVGQCPCLAFVNPHQWGVDDVLCVHGFVERHVEATYEVVAAVGVAREVGLGNASYEVADAALVGVDGGDAQEEEVAAWHEGVGRACGGFLTVHSDVAVGEGTGAGQLADETGVYAVEMYAGVLGYLACEVNFVHVFLSVGETEGPHFFKVGLCPKEAGGGVLPSAENNEGAFVVEVLHFLLDGDAWCGQGVGDSQEGTHRVPLDFCGVAVGKFDW